MADIRDFLDSNILDSLFDYIEDNGGVSEDRDINEKIDMMNPIKNKGATARENKKIVFKGKVSELTSKELLEAVLDTESNPSIYYKNIKKVWNRASALNENIVEMLFFYMKGIREQVYKDKIINVVRDIHEENNDYIIEAYDHILRNWNFEECLEEVLKTISEFRIRELNEAVYELFLRNIRLRIETAMVIFNNCDEKYYRRIFEVLCGTKDLTEEQTEDIKELFIKFAKLDNKNIKYLYKYYINEEKNFDSRIRRIIESNISYNISSEILDDMEKKLPSRDVSRTAQRRIVDILTRKYGEIKNYNNDRTNSRDRVKVILEMSKGFTHINTDKILSTINDDLDIKMAILKDREKNIVVRSNALIDVCKRLDKNKREIILKNIQESEKFEEVLKVVAISIEVENGNLSKITDLVKYIIRGEGESSKQAMHQIGRLRNINNPAISEKLKNLCEKLLGSEDNSRIGGMLKIMDVYLKGRATDDVVDIFLRKLENSNQDKVQNKIIEFFKEGYIRFNRTNKEKINKAIIKCSSNPSLAKKSQEYLRNINKLKDATPTLQL